MRWEQITWIFMHAYANKINDDFFKGHKTNCCGLIEYICKNLPCPICRTHANNYLSLNNIYHCKNKKDLQFYLWNFHNNVNDMLKKPIYEIKHLEKYNRSIFSNIVNKFIVEFKRPYYYGKTMDSWMRKKSMTLVEQYIKINWVHFS
jgi:hypothetical protein